jgi:hypothetical protein
MKSIFHILLLAAIAFAGSRDMLFDRDTIVSHHIYVPESTTCTINPGVSIKFTGYWKFVVKGLLIARGTAEKPVLITCEDRPRGAMGQPCWNGLVIYGKKAQALLSHCIIEGAYKNIIWESAPVFDSCEFAGNHYALYCIKSTPHIKACLIHRNVYGITSDYATPLLLGNTVTENTFGVYLQLDTKLIAGKNIIANNKTDIRTEQCLGATKNDMALQRMWDFMRELY